MGQVLHRSATTTEAIRRAIQHSQESMRALARRHGINPKTVAKWKKRESTVDRRTGPTVPRSTVLSVEQEAIIVAFRKHTLLPLDDCLYALQATIPQLTRSSLHRCLERHGISRLPEIEGDPNYQGLGGTGSFSISANGTPNGIYDIYDFCIGVLESLNVQFNDSYQGQTPLSFDLSGLASEQYDYAYVSFNQGTLTALDYMGYESSTYELSLDAVNLTYALYQPHTQFPQPDAILDSGTISLNASASVTPEPSSLILLCTGLLAGCGVVRRRLA